MAQNIYEDTGYSDPDGMATKASLVWLLNRTLLERQVESAAAAQLLGLARDDLERLRKGEFRFVSPEQLLAYLRQLGYDIEVRISPSSGATSGELRLSPPPHLDAGLRP